MTDPSAASPLAATLLAAVMLAVGCKGNLTNAPDANLDLGSESVPDTNRDIVSDSILCCPIETPGCGCFGYGGPSYGGSCPRICDAGPSNWRLTIDPSGCPMLVQTVGDSCLGRLDGGFGGAPGTDGSGLDGSASDASLALAFIKMSRSTNSPEIDVTVYADGSAARSVGSPPGVLNVTSRSYDPGSPEVAAFLTDLRAVGDLSAIATSQCPKSVSFGTTTTIVAGGQTSGDLQCLDNPSAAATALARDCGSSSERPPPSSGV